MKFWIWVRGIYCLMSTPTEKRNDILNTNKYTYTYVYTWSLFLQGESAHMWKVVQASHQPLDSLSQP